MAGRSNSSQPPDLAVPSAHDTVGRRHAEITFGSDGACYVVDLGSANGTFVAQGKNWKRVSQTTLSMDDRLRLGEYETSPRQLLDLRRAKTPKQAPKQDPGPAPVVKHSDRRPRRNPETGEIE